MTASKRFSLVTTIAIVAAVSFAWFNKQDIFDWWRLRSYSAPLEIAQLAQATTMSQSAEKYFFIGHPELNDKSEFNTNCSELGEQTIILGCYISGVQRIYLLDVDDPRLNGVKEVTAAHEMLHAAYDRLNAKERANVDKMTAAAYASINDKRINETIESYKKAGADIANELHSILATEVKNLPEELENYYSRYFISRSKVVDYAIKYESAFSSRKNKAEGLLSQIKSLEKQLLSLRSQIDRLESNLVAERAELERTRGNIDTQTYNSLVTDYNTNVDEYRGYINQYNNLVKQHNSLVTQYEEITLETNELVKAIDSRSTTVQNQ